MASFFMPLTHVSAGKNTFAPNPITFTVRQACQCMGMSPSTFYRRQKQRLEALRLIEEGANASDFAGILAFPMLLKEANEIGGFARSFVRHIDIIMWSQQLMGGTQP